MASSGLDSASARRKGRRLRAPGEDDGGREGRLGATPDGSGRRVALVDAGRQHPQTSPDSGGHGIGPGGSRMTSTRYHLHARGHGLPFLDEFRVRTEDAVGAEPTVLLERARTLAREGWTVWLFAESHAAGSRATFDLLDTLTPLTEFRTRVAPGSGGCTPVPEVRNGPARAEQPAPVRSARWSTRATQPRVGTPGLHRDRSGGRPTLRRPCWQETPTSRPRHTLTTIGGLRR